jgi:hypothetical protein
MQSSTAGGNGAVHAGAMAHRIKLVWLIHARLHSTSMARNSTQRTVHGKHTAWSAQQLLSCSAADRVNASSQMAHVCITAGNTSGTP